MQLRQKYFLHFGCGEKKADWVVSLTDSVQKLSQTAVKM